MSVMRFLLRLLINALALVVAAWLVPGIEIVGGPLVYLALAVLFGVVNATLGLVLRVMACPLILLTLGLFTLVINGLMLQLSAWCAAQFGLGVEVTGFWAAFFGALVVSIVSAVLSTFVSGPKRETEEVRQRR
jgi:putative membrane protein